MRLIFDYDYAVIDVETTGLRREDQIVQLGIVQIDHGRPRLRVTMNFRPTVDMDFRAEAVHGLSREVLEAAHPFNELAPDILHLLGERVLIGFGNWRFDDKRLLRALLPTQLLPTSIDVYQLFKTYTSAPLPQTLEAATRYFGLPEYARHNAFDDCRSAWNVFRSILMLQPELVDRTPQEVGKTYTSRDFDK